MKDEYGWLTGEQIIKEHKLGDIEIEPFNIDCVNSNSYNYTISKKLLKHDGDIIDLRAPDKWVELEIPEDGILLHPGECYLGCTNERFGSNKFASLITGRSSMGRKFITNHVTAGLIDQGFFGQITLEIVVHKITRLYADIRFGQIFWFTTFGDSRTYAGKYQQQKGPTPARSIDNET